MLAAQRDVTARPALAEPLFVLLTKVQCSAVWKWSVRLMRQMQESRKGRMQKEKKKGLATFFSR